MRKQILLAAFVVLALAKVSAQETNALPIYTDIEAFEAQIGVVIVKAREDLGNVAAKNGSISVWAKESQNVSTGQKIYGLALAVKSDAGEDDTTIFDYDELDPFLAAIDFVSNVNGDATTLSSFSAGFTSKGGARIVAYTSNKHSGTIQISLQSNHAFKSRVVLERDQLARFKILIQETKAKLDALREKKP